MSLSLVWEGNKEMDVAIRDINTGVESSRWLREFYKIRVAVHVKQMFNHVSLHF